MPEIPHYATRTTQHARQREEVVKTSVVAQNACGILEPAIPNDMREGDVAARSSNPRTRQIKAGRISIRSTRRFAVRFMVRFAAECRFGLFHGFDVAVGGTVGSIRADDLGSRVRSSDLNGSGLRFRCVLRYGSGRR
ncbi:unnamed protein product [Ectocarpus sp. 13 AM-2016]